MMDPDGAERNYSNSEQYLIRKESLKHTPVSAKNIFSTIGNL